MHPFKTVWIEIKREFLSRDLINLFMGIWDGQIDRQYDLHMDGHLRKREPIGQRLYSLLSALQLSTTSRDIDSCDAAQKMREKKKISFWAVAMLSSILFHFIYCNE